MKENKFYFNPNTLVFDVETTSVRERLFHLGKFFLRVMVLSVFVFIAVNTFFDSPKYLYLTYKRQHYINQYHNTIHHLESIENRLHQIQRNDEASYRLYAELESLPFDIRNAGYGGNENITYEENYLHSYHIVNEAFNKADNLTMKFNIQQESFHQILDKIKEKENRLASIPGILPMLNSDIKRISDIFGMRYHPIFHTRKMHCGIDYSAPVGTPIYSPGDGTVDFIGYESGYGKLIVINHGYGIISIYGHLSDILVYQGQKIKRGNLIAKVGDTGSSTGPHLHYEIRVNNKPVNPAQFYINDLSPEDYLTIVSNSVKKRGSQSF